MKLCMENTESSCVQNMLTISRNTDNHRYDYCDQMNRGTKAKRHEMIVEYYSMLDLIKNRGKLGNQGANGKCLEEGNPLELVSSHRKEIVVRLKEERLTADLQTPFYTSM